jgi:hypothetical protein
VKEYNTNAFKALTVGNDGKLIRLHFGTTEGDVGFLMPASALPEFIPIFLAADVQAKQRAGTGDAVHAFNVKQMAVKIPAEKKGIVVTMTIFQNLDLSFWIETKFARRFLNALVEHVAQSEEAAKSAS